MAGPHEISIHGTFDGGTVTHFTFDTEEGRGAAARSGTTVEETYESSVVHSEFVISGGGGSEDVKVIAKLLASMGRG